MQDAGLLLRTTNLQESTIRRYHITSYSTATKLDIDKVPGEEEKLPGMQLSGTQATLLFSSLAVPPDDALAACQQLLSMVSTLCPPVQLVLKAQDLLLIDEAADENVVVVQQNEAGQSSANSTATTATATASLPTTTTFARQLEPLPLTHTLSPAQRLKTGLLEEFPSSIPPPSTAISSPQQQQQPPPILSFVGVGEGAIPRGCKWTACAGVVLQLPDHTALAAVHAQSENSHLAGPEVDLPSLEAPAVDKTTILDNSPTPAYVFKSHAVQFTENINYIDALKRVNWSGYGFKLLEISSGESSFSPSAAVEVQEQQASIDPVAVTLRCEQPESMASIAAIVVHLYCPTTTPSLQAGATQNSQDSGSGGGGNASSQGQKKLPPLTKLAPLHQRTLIRTAIEAALSDLKQQCPSVVCDRRDRSLMKALPVVSSAVAEILNRAVGEGVLVEACQALRVREVGELADALHRKLEEVVIYTQQQQQQQQQRGEGDSSARGA